MNTVLKKSMSIAALVAMTFASSHALAAEKIESGIYNIVAPIHPTKGEVGENDIERRGLPAGYWDYSVSCLGGKVVSGDKICNELNYEFRWPDPLEFPL